jgi:hypothetical protein
MATAEGVIISGPYRGGIVALDKVQASVARLSAELRATTAALHQPAEVIGLWQ